MEEEVVRKVKLILRPAKEGHSVLFVDNGQDVAALGVVNTFDDTGRRELIRSLKTQLGTIALALIPDSVERKEPKVPAEEKTESPDDKTKGDRPAE